MRIIVTAAAATSLALMGAQGAAAKPDRSDDANKQLRQGLASIIIQSHPPGQSKRPLDPDQGDDNAADRAINVVCTMNTPAADRSAICDREPITPH